MSKKLLIVLGLFLSIQVHAKSHLWFSKDSSKAVTAIASLNGKVLRSYPLLDGYLTVFELKEESDVQLIQSFKGLGDIIESNDIVEVFVTGSPFEIPSLNSDYRSFQWGLDNKGNNEPVRLDRRSPVPGKVGADVSAKTAWDMEKGSRDIVVAVMDTGVDYNHSDLKENMWINQAELNGRAGVDDDGNGFIDDIRGWDFVNKDNDPMDDMGHGTHCAGIIGASHNSRGIDGVMEQVSIMPVKFLDKKGRGSMEQTIVAMEYTVKMKPDVINASWGSSRESEIMKKLIEKALENGTVVVAAAGNLRGRNNDTSPTYPANYNYSNVISVSAHNAQDYHSAFSTWGPQTVHMAAPGTNIVSTFPGGGYKVWSGTSMAAPHVAGAVGLLFSREVKDTAVVRDRLMSTTIKVEKLAGKNLSSGRLNLPRLILDERREL